MKRTYLLCAALMALSLPAYLPAQAFVNGSLAGTISTSVAPTSWAQVPDTDPVSQATQGYAATSDVTGTTGPLLGNISGNPYEGTTYVTGLNCDNGSAVYQEGIQQSVSGFTVGTAYNISFYQCVTKQSNVYDNSGCWAVYKDGTLIGISATCIDNVTWGSNSHPWFRRQLTFTATSTTHLIKFLPIDDDVNILNTAGVRMGIDSITLRVATPFATPMAWEIALENENDVRITWTDANVEGLAAFTIEHSPDGYKFEPIATVALESQNQYTYLDPKPFVESYYRIGRQEIDGGITYSEVQHITTQAPVNVDIRHHTLDISGGYGGDYDVTLFNLEGKNVYTDRVQGSANLGELQSGIYLLRIVSIGKEKVQLEKKIFLE